MTARRSEADGLEPYRETAFRATLQPLEDGRWRVFCHIIETDTGDVLRKAIDETVSTEQVARDVLTGWPYS